MKIKTQKRVLDLIISTLLLFLLLPVLMLISIAILLSSKGNPIFIQKRVGLNEEIFRVYKFRTMIRNAEKMGTGLYSYSDDPRVTSLGKYLRDFSLDELPQIVNVLTGKMSIVGPRPPVFGELDNEKSLPKDTERRFSVQPGITGLAQVRGRNANSWESKILLDLDYVSLLGRKGIWIDLKLMIETIQVLINRKNVIEKRPENENKA